MNIRAFTLVELIVVITILSILATVGFMSFSSYLVGARDTNRLAQIKSMSDALEIYKVRKKLPIPDDKIDIQANGKTIAYQGYIGQNVLSKIGYSEKGFDPKDKKYFTYMLSKDRKYFQLLTFLEEQNDDIIAGHYLSKSVKASDYSLRIPKTQGKRLGILIDDRNIPIQENPAIQLDGYLDIVTTDDTYTGVIQDGYSLTGTGTELQIIESNILVGGVKNSCKEILKKNPRFKSKDGYYLISQQKPSKIYCDMTTDGGGWSRYVNITDEYSFQDAKNCWLSNRSIINLSGTIECYNPNRLNFIVEDFMIKTDADNNGNITSDEVWTQNFTDTYPSQIENIQTTHYKCRGGEKYMSVMSSAAAFPNNELTNVQWIRLGLSYCNESINSREVGGVSIGQSYMNYSSVNSSHGPVPGNRDSTVKPTQLFIR